MRREEPVEAFCRSCRRPTQHQVEWSLGHDYEFQEADWLSDIHQDYQLVRCLGCTTPGFRLVELQLAGYDPFDEGYVALFPQPIEVIKELNGRSWRMFQAAQLVKDVYPPAAAALLRVCAESLIENIARAKLNEEDFNDWLYGESKSKKKFHLRIGDLATRNVIGPSTKTAFDLLKHFGNAAVHELSTIDTTDTVGDTERLFELIELIVADSIRVPAILAELSTKVSIEKREGDAGRDEGLTRKKKKGETND